MNKLALQLPGFSSIPEPSGLNNQFKDLGSFISPLLNVVFYVVVFLAFFWLVWGAFAYILAGGNKEGLAKARARITWALIGLAVTFLAFSIAKFAGSVLIPPTQGGLPF